MYSHIFLVASCEVRHSYIYPHTHTFYYGYISNEQIYNTALTASQISTLYSEGITNPPISPTNLVD